MPDQLHPEDLRRVRQLAADHAALYARALATRIANILGDTAAADHVLQISEVVGNTMRSHIHLALTQLTTRSPNALLPWTRRHLR